ncbi:DUF5914 domain-containing protein [Streptomyces reniochalinae]|uniref:Rieske (2Fe-2S) protein n=1 Tax=Streptomyces reniochalinae TaxID=2250578 RepID=A0A367F4D7_9ACTN|nr:DUF5914 domain-containing protein [Streptomyces reniochalinae]RCG25238.1 Rieske (2Fe-2S) protein [Streptomyces reniochalinae]
MTDGAPPAPPRTRRTPLALRRRAVPWERQRPTWRAARAGLIEDALRRAGKRPSGNWYVLGAAREMTRGRPLGRTVAGVEVVAWYDAQGRIRAGAGACPHLGAPLKDSPVRCGQLVCHWHGMAFDGRPKPGWEPYPAYDDGVLAWVRLDGAGGEEPTERPVVPTRPRPGRSVEAVHTAVGRCTPDDIVANRLDPWHGAWFHPYSFVDLTVVSTPDEAPGGGAQGGEVFDGFVVDVSFKVAGRAVVPVRAVFTAPEPRTVVMHITAGEGRGSVVETHATPLESEASGEPRTLVTEAVVAHSPRAGFALARACAPVLRTLLRTGARRLWLDDLAYAERRWHLRSTRRFPG